MRNITAGLLFSGAMVIAACASDSVLLVNPRTGASVKCAASGSGLMAPAATGMVDDCIRRYPDYVPVDRLTPAERADLERRGALPY
ncbi:MAG TPA: hypothetical protein VL754_14065 [Verrucomicrobiae bacterium]|jgi:hypothetical protein|nr:hypothetical protein [Verrucomicrobiae bacterium]